MELSLTVQHFLAPAITLVTPNLLVKTTLVFSKETVTLNAKAPSTALLTKVDHNFTVMVVTLSGINSNAPLLSVASLKVRELRHKGSIVTISIAMKDNLTATGDMGIVREHTLHECCP